ncbi:hypothetical protein C8F04DRAFT_578277 [Mycena alexandri]|uniref:Uncharacterized protein n=1 Tax=Mycena alexandri TaxID=1745969 RepID=A0AAD6SUF9_9AGAR|nr:hypothetical protein C8F04DRAFT_578277 [Mycena alexandri]
MLPKPMSRILFITASFLASRCRIRTDNIQSSSLPISQACRRPWHSVSSLYEHSFFSSPSRRQPSALKMAVVVDHVFMLVASWMNCLLFMLESVLLARYFQHSSRPLKHKLGVAAIFTSDLLCTMALCTQVYSSVLTSPCDTSHLLTDAYFRTLCVIVVTTNTTASLAQGFLCSLYFNLTKNRRLSTFLVFTIALHVTFSYTSAIMLLFNLLQPGKVILTAKIGTISCAATDAMIAAALLNTFIGMETTIAVRDSTHSLLRRLIVLFFTSGVVVASTTLLALILGLRNTPASYLFIFAQGRMYGLTILGNFVMGVATQHAVTTPSVPTTAVTGVVFYLDHSAADLGATSVASNYSRHTVVMEMDVREDTLSSAHAK